MSSESVDVVCLGEAADADDASYPPPLPPPAWIRIPTGVVAIALHALVVVALYRSEVGCLGWVLAGQLPIYGVRWYYSARERRMRATVQQLQADAASTRPVAPGRQVWITCRGIYRHTGQLVRWGNFTAYRWDRDGDTDHLSLRYRDVRTLTLLCVVAASPLAAGLLQATGLALCVPVYGWRTDTLAAAAALLENAGRMAILVWSVSTMRKPVGDLVRRGLSQRRMVVLLDANSPQCATVRSLLDTQLPQMVAEEG